MATKRKTKGRKPILKDRTCLTVYVDAAQKRRLEREAKRNSISVGAVVRECIAAVVG